MQRGGVQEREPDSQGNRGWKGRRLVLVMTVSDPLCPLHLLAHQLTPALNTPALGQDQGISRSPSLDLNESSVYLWKKQFWTKYLFLSRPGEKVGSGGSVVLLFRDMSGYLIPFSTQENQRMDEEWQTRCVRPRLVLEAARFEISGENYQGRKMSTVLVAARLLPDFLLINAKVTQHGRAPGLMPKVGSSAFCSSLVTLTGGRVKASLKSVCLAP